LTARIWNPLTGQPLTRPLKLTEPVREISFSPGGRWLAICGQWSFQIWDVHSGIPVSLIQTTEEELSGGMFLDDRRWVSVTEAGVVKEFRLDTLTWPAEKTARAMELLSGMVFDGNGDLSPTAPAGLESSPTRRQQAEEAWLWLRERLPPVSEPSP